MSRQNDQAFFSHNKVELAKDDQHDLALITKDGKGRYWLDHAVKEGTEAESVNRLWLLARFLEDENGKRDYLIEKFDTIRVGRVRLRVKDFRCNGQQTSPAELHAQELREAKNVKTLKDFNNGTEQQENQCRICWGGESDAKNPLIVPC